jgi:hypothetical protein
MPIKNGAIIDGMDKKTAFLLMLVGLFTNKN